MGRSIPTRFRTFYDVHAFRSSITSLGAVPQFALLGILAGIVIGLVILLFRGLIEFTLFLLLPMEAILMEYTIAGFMPVILASVTGTLVVQIFLGSASMFSVPSVGLSQWQEIPFVVAGLLLGCLAAALIHGVRFVHRYAPKRMVGKITLAGATTAIIGLWIPEILGVGYDTVNFALAGQLGLLALTLIVSAKLVATLVSVAFGLPIGVIGPTLFIGATAGSILWQLSQSVGFSDTDPAFFALLGMGAMMGATLNAPLSAPMAIMELTQNSEIVLPAMLCIVIATITAVHGLKMPSLFNLQLQLQGIQISTTPMRQALSRVGVETLSNPNFDTVPQLIAREDLMSILEREVDWLLIESEDLSDRLISASAARDYLSTDQSAIIDFSGPLEALLSAAQVPWQATLDEAFDIIVERNVERSLFTGPPQQGCTSEQESCSLATSTATLADALRDTNERISISCISMTKNSETLFSQASDILPGG